MDEVIKNHDIIDSLTSQVDKLTKILAERENNHAAERLAFQVMKQAEEDKVMELKQELEDLKAENASNENALQIGKQLENLKNMNRTKASIEGQRFYTAAIAQAPTASIDSISMAIPLIIAAFLSDLGIGNNINLEDIPKGTPCANSLRSNLWLACEQVFMEIADSMIAGVPHAVLSDKKKCGLERLVTQLASFNFVTEKVDVKTVSSDGSEATDRGAAEAIDFLLQCVDEHMPEGVHAKIFGSLSDAGGAGVGERLMEQLQENFDRVHVGSYTLTCAMHALARAFQVAFEAAFGKSGLGCKTNTTVG